MVLPGNLTAPVVVWGKTPPSHRITCICHLVTENAVITGSHDGQLCVWTLGEDLKPVPIYFLIGHSSAITCISQAGLGKDSGRFVSASDDGEMLLWDVADGRCLEQAKGQNVHVKISMQMFVNESNSLDVYLFTCGHYYEVQILDARSLLPVVQVSSRTEPDWIASFCVVQPPGKPHVLIGLTTSNVIKMWTLTSEALHKAAMSHEPLCEDESKQLRGTLARDIQFCPSNPREVLIVFPDKWKIFDASDFSLLLEVSCPKAEQWVGGTFLSPDKVVACGSDGTLSLYQLPRKAVTGKASSSSSIPPQLTEALLYCILKDAKSNTTSSVKHAFSFSRPLVSTSNTSTDAQAQSTLLAFKGAFCGSLSVFRVPEASPKNIVSLMQHKDAPPPFAHADAAYGISEAWFDNAPTSLAVFRVPEASPKNIVSLMQHKDAPPPFAHADAAYGISEAWRDASASVCGIVETLSIDETGTGTAAPEVTATLHIQSQGRLALGRRDGAIVLVSATGTLMRQLLIRKISVPETVPHLLLLGHRGAVTALCYPNEEHPRYESKLLVSGGADFSVCVWNLNDGCMIRRFSNQAGEILGLLVPPDSCNPRILNSICSVGADHSVALLSLKESKCILLASKHLYPVRQIRWRPLDDFLVVETEDSTVYVWQMETGHLDRIITGIIAKEVLTACNLQTGDHGTEDAMANSAVKMFRAIRHKNVSAIKKIAEGASAIDPNSADQSDAGFDPDLQPLSIQPFRTSPSDPDSHLIMFSVEPLVIELVREEQVATTPAARQEEPRIQPGSGSPVISGILGAVRDKAENVSHRIQYSAENVLGVSPGTRRKADLAAQDKAKQRTVQFDTDSTLYMDTAHLLLSLLHAWGMDADLDRVCAGKLGLARPSQPLCYGLVSPQGHMTLMLPSYSLGAGRVTKSPAFEHFARHLHWRVSPSITTQHLLSIIVTANALMETSCASFLTGMEAKRRALRRYLASNSIERKGGTPEDEQMRAAFDQSSQLKHGWSLLAALHCVLLPELVPKGCFEAPRIELLARKWQDRCLQLRDASQALLLRELARLGAGGRRLLIEQWSPFLPVFLDASMSLFGSKMVSSQPSMPSAPVPSSTTSSLNAESEGDGDQSSLTDMTAVSWSRQELRRHQTTAVILLAVIGSEYPQELVPPTSGHGHDSGHSLAMAVGSCLLELVLHPATHVLPAYGPLRGAAVDLIARGFPTWQPYLDISKVLLGLLELAVGSVELVPNETVMTPLPPRADLCRSACRSLQLISAWRPPAVITALCKELARYHQTAHQQGNQLMVLSPLPKAKHEILKMVELLAEKQHSDVVDLMIPVGDILVFCLDSSLLKQRALQDVFPAIAKFSMVCYCNATRRIAFGGKNGVVAIHELRSSKNQTIQAHGKPITACAFSEDGKHLSTYSAQEGKITFWQTSQSFLGMGQSQIKCVRQLQAPQEFPVTSPGGSAATFKARLVWTSAKAVTVLLPNGKEHRISMV